MLRVGGQAAYAYTGGKPFDAALPTVVFIHGALHDHGVWTLLARWFAHHGRSVLAVDLPGHMRSDGPALASVEAMADWVIAVLDAAGVQRAALAGHSMGSLIALEATARAPERITHLAMLGTAYPMKVSDALLEAARHDPHRAIEMVTQWGIAGVATKPGYPSPGVWLHGAARAYSRQILGFQRDPLLYHTDFAACHNYAGGEAAAARVRCPVTFVLAESDQMTPPKAARSLAAALKAEVFTVPGGHLLMQQSPDAVLNALRHRLPDGGTR